MLPLRGGPASFKRLLGRTARFRAIGGATTLKNGCCFALDAICGAHFSAPIVKASGLDVELPLRCSNGENVDRSAPLDVGRPISSLETKKSTIRAAGGRRVAVVDAEIQSAIERIGTGLGSVQRRRTGEQR